MNRRRLITIGREYGSGGREIGERVAKLLGINFYDREIINLASQKSGLSLELFDKADEKRSFSLQSAGFSLRTSLIDDMSTNYFLSNESLFNIQSEVIREIAQKEEAVFVGRCADYVLKDFCGLLSLFIVSDIDDRIKRVSQRNNISLQTAANLIEKEDKRRASYYNYFSDKRWGESHSYHLSINSSILGIEGSAQIIAFAITQRGCTDLL